MDNLYEQALDAITKLFSSTGVEVSETIENLNSLISEIQIMIESLDSPD